MKFCALRFKIHLIINILNWMYQKTVKIGRNVMNVFVRRRIQIFVFWMYWFASAKPKFFPKHCSCLVKCAQNEAHFLCNIYFINRIVYYIHVTVFSCQYFATCTLCSFVSLASKTIRRNAVFIVIYSESANVIIIEFQNIHRINYYYEWKMVKFCPVLDRKVGISLSNTNL